MKVFKLFRIHDGLCATNLFAAMFALSLTGCLETTIKDSFVDRTAPEAAGTPSWLDPANSDALVSNAAYSQQSSMKASWVPSASADMTAQGVQLYIGAACNIASGSPVQYSGKTQSSHVFTGLPDGAYSFKVISYDRKNNASYSDCSTGFTVDTSPPAVTVSAATSWINDTNKSSYAVSGTCADAGAGISGNVRVKLAKNASNYLDQLTPCTNGLFSINLDTTVLTVGAFSNGVSNLSLTATVADQIGNNGESAQQTVSRDILAPTLASLNSAEWINNSSKSAYAVTGTCSDATSGLSGKTITVTMTSGAGAGAVTATGTAICSGGSFTANVNASVFADTATANISITAAVEDVAGNVTTAAAITRKKDTVLPVLAITSPVTGGYVNATASVPVTFTLVEENATSSQTFAFTYDNGSGPSSSTVAVTNGPFTSTSKGEFIKNISTSGLSNGTSVSVSIAYSDPAGNAATTASSNYTIDTGVPTITSFSLNSGNANTDNNNVLVSLNANNTLSPVTHYCLKYNSTTAPTEQDPCWTAISQATTGSLPSQTVTLSGFYFQVGFIQANYDVYAWVKNQSGLMSSLRAGPGEVGKDKFTVNYDPGTPPVINKLQVTNIDIPSNPVLRTELSALEGTSIFIKWDASDADGNLAPNPISIYYSTDNKNYLPLSTSPLANGPGQNCSIGGTFTGCVQLTSPSSSAYRVRVVAVDTNGTTVFYNSEVMNSPNFRILAGNTESGIGGSAKTANFIANGTARSYSYNYANHMAVSSDGKYFYLDPTAGLIWINPANGNLNVFIKKGAQSSDDGSDGSIINTNTTLKLPLGIAMDYKDRLLIFDNDRIRRVDFTTNKISTIIGGGNLNLHDQTDVVTDPRSVRLTPGLKSIVLTMTMIPMPNGDLWFASPDPDLFKLLDWKYVESESTKALIPIKYTDSNSYGMASEPALTWNFTVNVWPTASRINFAIEFNPETSIVSRFFKGFSKQRESDTFPHYAKINPVPNNNVYDSQSDTKLAHLSYGTLVTGMDGKIYKVGRFRTRLHRYNSELAAPVELILGETPTSGANQDESQVIPNGLCPENTLATSCRVDIETFFVSKTGRIYFMDQGALRTIVRQNNEDRVITLFGQSTTYNGDNPANRVVPALNARLGYIMDLKLDRSNGNNNRFIVLDSLSGTYREVNRDGNATILTDASYYWHGPFKFELDPRNGDIFSPRDGSTISRYKKDTNQWSMIVGGGSTDYRNGDGLSGLSVSFASYNGSIVGYFDDEIYYYKNRYNYDLRITNDCMVKKYSNQLSSPTYTQNHFMGIPGDYSCNDSFGWVGNLPSDTKIGHFSNISRIEKIDGKILIARPGNDLFYVDADGKLQMYTHRPNSNTSSFTARKIGSDLYSYYCTGDSKITRQKLSTGELNEYVLPEGVYCSGSATPNLISTATSNSIVFSFQQNGLYGIAEYFLPE